MAVTKAPDDLFVVSVEGVLTFSGQKEIQDKLSSAIDGRPNSAKPLPRRLLFLWTTDDGRSHTRKITLASSETMNKDPMADALVFEILPAEAVNVYREIYSARRWLK